MGVLQESCANCGHSFSFHGKRPGAKCKAVGCHAGPKGFVCQGFVARKDASEDLVAALSVTA
jgi:hypothetical protein